MIRPIIRLATDDEGEDIRHILSECGQIPEGLDWSRVHPCWLVAEYKGIIVGCVQTIIGYPLGHFGFWAVLPSYQNYGIGIFLWKAAERVFAQSGCDGFTGLTANPQVLKHLGKAGGITFGDKCDVIFKRVYRGRSNGAKKDHNHDETNCSGANG